MNPIARIVKVLMRDLATRGRVIALGGLGMLAVGLGAAVRTANAFDRPEAAWSLVNGYGLGLLVPVVTLVFASAALGDPAEDGTLVYLWLRPLPRWKLAVSAFIAALAVAVPLAVIPLVLGAALTGEGVKIVAGAAAGGFLAAVG